MDTVRASTLFDRPDTSRPGNYIPLCVPQLQGNEWKYLKECLDTGWVSSAGPFVDRFERELAANVGAKHAVAVVNGTSALHVALRVVGLRPEEEVLVPNLTFVAPVNAIRYCQVYPVLIDADPKTWQMDVDKVARFLARECEMKGTGCYNKRSGRRVRAILPVHLLGLACEINRIVVLGRQYGLRVVEDAAEGLGARYRGHHHHLSQGLGHLGYHDMAQPLLIEGLDEVPVVESSVETDAGTGRSDRGGKLLEDALQDGWNQSIVDQALSVLDAANASHHGKDMGQEKMAG